MKTKKIAKALIVSMLLTSLFCMTSFADESITSVSVSMNEAKTEAGIVYEMEPKVSSRQYEIVDYNATKNYDEWRPGTKITYDITLEPKEGYRFNSSKIKTINVSNGEVVSKSVKGSQITMKINYIPKVTLENPTNIYYEDEYLGVWDKVEYCKMYEVQILKENENGELKNHKTVKVTKPEIDLSSFATDEFSVSFKVRAIAKDSAQSKYLKSSNWVNADESVSSDNNTSYGNFTGKGDNLVFKDSEGKVAGWQLINGSWYYFNPNNGNKAIVSNWLQVDSKWYYFNDYGIMQTGWLKINEYWYYFNPRSDGTQGVMVTGWLTTGPNGPWYYLQPGIGGLLPEGAMYSDRQTPDGYYVNSSGEWR